MGTYYCPIGYDFCPPLEPTEEHQPTPPQCCDGLGGVVDAIFVPRGQPVPPGRPSKPAPPPPGEAPSRPIRGPGLIVPPLFPTLPKGPGNPLAPVTNTSTQTSATGGAIAIANATATAINNAVSNYSIQNNIDTGPIGSAIDSGIGNVVDSINRAQIDTTQAIQSSLTGFSNGLFDFAKNVGAWLVSHIQDVLSAIASHLKDIVGTIIDTVTKAVKGALDALSGVVGPLIQKIASSVQAVVDFYRNTIQPILQTVSQVVQAIAATEKAIQADLHAGIQGLLNLPTDIANGLNQIDQALIRAGLALRVKRKSDADVYFYGDEPGSFAAHIKSLGEAVIGLGVTKEKTTYQPGKERLDEPTLAQDLPALMQAVFTILSDICKGISNLPTDFTGILEILGITGAGLAVGFASPFLLLGSALAMVRGPFNVVSELAEQRAYQAAPILKLSPEILTEAVRRGFIDSKTMDAEMVLQGYDGVRSDLLRQLSVFLEPASTLVDYLFRQIITDEDFSSGLSDLGYTSDQIAAAKEAATRILDVQDILTAWRRNEVEEQTVADTLRANRFTDAQIELLKTLAFAPAGYAEANRHFLTSRFLADYGFDPSALPQPPKEVRDAGRADGLSDAAINARWNGAISTLDPSQWLAMYWRGKATFKQLQVALDTIRVPDFLQQIWVDSQRPLIPFRTIPSMIRSGILSESEGLQKLQAHGYTLDDATLLIRYAGTSGRKSGPALAATQHEISIAAARTLYNDGAITRDQFSSILAAHGFDASNVALEIQLADIQNHAAQRRQFGTDVVNEFLAGMLTHDEAVQTIESSPLSDGEKAKYIKSLRASKLSKVKLPSEPELRQMAIHQIIPVDDYTSGLVAIGFSPEWANRFTALHFGSGTTP